MSRDGVILLKAKQVTLWHGAFRRLTLTLTGITTDSNNKVQMFHQRLIQMSSRTALLLHFTVSYNLPFDFHVSVCCRDEKNCWWRWLQFKTFFFFPPESPWIFFQHLFVFCVSSCRKKTMIGVSSCISIGNRIAQYVNAERNWFEKS